MEHMEQMNLILKIQSAFNQFTKAEKKVAEYCLANREKVLFLSITDLAEACGVGEASVFRFCRTLGLSGYQEFKMQMSLSQTFSGAKETADREDGREDGQTGDGEAIEAIARPALGGEGVERQGQLRDDGHAGKGVGQPEDRRAHEGNGKGNNIKKRQQQHDAVAASDRMSL